MSTLKDLVKIIAVAVAKKWWLPDWLQHQLQRKDVIVFSVCTHGVLLLLSALGRSANLLLFFSECCLLWKIIVLWSAALPRLAQFLHESLQCTLVDMQPMLLVPYIISLPRLVPTHVLVWTCTTCMKLKEEHKPCLITLNRLFFTPLLSSIYPLVVWERCYAMAAVVL